MPLSIKITGSTFTDTTLPILYDDAVMTAGSVFCYDFKNPLVWPAQADAVLNDTFGNLVSGGGAATAMGPLTFAGGGFDFTIAVGPVIQLPAAAGLTASANGFVATVWMKHETQTQEFAGDVFGYRTTTEGVWGLRYQNPHYYAMINGEDVQVQRAPFEDNLPHQIALA